MRSVSPASAVCDAATALFARRSGRRAHLGGRPADGKTHGIFARRQFHTVTACRIELCVVDTQSSYVSFAAEQTRWLLRSSRFLRTWPRPFARWTVGRSTNRRRSCFLANVFFANTNPSRRSAQPINFPEDVACKSVVGLKPCFEPHR